MKSGYQLTMFRVDPDSFVLVTNFIGTLSRHKKAAGFNNLIHNTFEGERKKTKKKQKMRIISDEYIRPVTRNAAQRSTDARQTYINEAENCTAFLVLSTLSCIN